MKINSITWTPDVQFYWKDCRQLILIKKRSQLKSFAPVYRMLDKVSAASFSLSIKFQESTDKEQLIATYNWTHWWTKNSQATTSPREIYPSSQGSFPFFPRLQITNKTTETCKETLQGCDKEFLYIFLLYAENCKANLRTQGVKKPIQSKFGSRVCSLSRCRCLSCSTAHLHMKKEVKYTT